MEIAALSFSAFVGSHLSKIGRKNSVVLGLFILSISTMSFGFLINFKNPWLFFASSMALRFIQGIGCAFANTAGK
jgi:MFS family permease